MALKLTALSAVSSSVLVIVATLWSWPQSADAQLLDLNLTYPDFTLVQPLGINRKERLLTSRWRSEKVQGVATKFHSGN